MSLEFIEGFDHYTVNSMIPRKWDNTNPNSGSQQAGRFGGNSWNLQNVPSLTKTLTSVATRVCGFAFYFSGSSVPGMTLVQYWDTGTTQCDLRIVGTGQLQVTRNGTVLGTSATGLINGNNWYYIEFKVTIGASGSYDVHVASASVLSGSGNTQNTANATSNQFVIGPIPNVSPTNFDDIYVLNSSGSANNTFLGESKIVTNLPSADSGSASTNTQWTPSAAGTHFSKVNESSPDDDSTYVYSATVAQLDTYKYPAATLSGTIAGVQVVLCERRDNTGARSTSVEYRSSGGTNYTGGNIFSLSSNYNMDRQIYETDPATSAAWTAAAVNGAEFGINLVA